MDNQDDDDKTESLFHEARGLPPDEREVFLEAYRRESPTIVARVRELLSACDSFAEITELREPGGFRLVLGQDTESLGKIGPYTLLQEIGSGGMGAIYRARQDSPVRREVAVKLIKADLPPKEVVARFEAERQAIAMMKHQNIAQLYDVGTTQDGQPYFAMELVAGDSFTAYCDKYNVPIRRRLELFIDVCEAVQHAHQKGIVHRDLKPQNILIAVDTADRKPTPKVIDFGLAKALGHHASLTNQPSVTQIGMFVGTPMYASPEQAEGSPDVDTLSDVYSLGVILYEVLTGSTPHSEAEDVLQAIQNEEPTLPSRQLTSNPESTTTVSEQRQISSQKLTQMLKGELDWVVMKALEKDRSRRYASVAALADDVRRFLHNEPVDARPPSVRYRMGKAIKRHKMAVLSGVLMLVILLAGLASTSWLAVIASRARMQAEQNAQSERQAKLAESEAKKEANQNYRTAVEAINMWLSPVDELREVPGMVEVRRELMLKAIKLYESLVREKSEFPEAELQRANVFAKMARLQTDIGQADTALRSLNEADTILKEISDAADEAFRIAAGRVELQRANTLMNLGRSDEALASYTRTINLLETSNKSSGIAELAHAFLLRGSANVGIGDFAAAEIDLLRATAEYRRSEDIPSQVRRNGIQQAQQYLSHVLCRTGNWAVGIAKLLHFVDSTNSKDDIVAADARFLLADLCMKACRPKLALTQIQAAISIYEKENTEYGPEFHRVVEGKHFCSLVLAQLGLVMDASEQAKSALAMCVVRMGDQPSDLRTGELKAQCETTVEMLDQLSGKTKDIDNGRNAVRWFNKIRSEYGEDIGTHSKMSRRAGIALSQVGKSWEFINDFRIARLFFELAIDAYVDVSDAHTPDDYDVLAEIYINLGRALKKSGQDSSESSKRAFELWEECAASNQMTPEIRNRYARALIHCPASELRNPRVAQSVLQEALKASPDSYLLIETLAAIRCELKEFQFAVTLLDRASELSSGPTPYHLAIQSRCYHRLGDKQAAVKSLTAARSIQGDTVPGDLDLTEIIQETGEELGL